MVSGERRAWVVNFRVTDRKFLRCVARVWWQAIAHLPLSSCEDTITVALIDSLSKDAEARDGFYCEYQFHPFTRSSRGSLTAKFRVDMAVIIHHDRTMYLAYECKKLNVTGTGGARRSQAGAYVGEEGMMRFVTEKYAEGLSVGCMLGYVMDGDLSFAYARIEAVIMAKGQDLGLEGPLEAEPPIAPAQRFVTKHSRAGKWIEMHHALLPFMDSMP